MVRKADQHVRFIRAAAVLLAALALAVTAFAGTARAEEVQSDLTEAAFELLEEGNPFVKRYEQLTGKTVETVFPDGVPYFFGGQSGAKGNGWLYLNYPDYHVHVCAKGSAYYREGKLYLYGLDCAGFTRYVFRACGKPAHPLLSDMLFKWELLSHHLYDFREGYGMPAYDQLKDTLQAGDLLVVRRDRTRTRHVMMYIGTLRGFGYTAEEEPSLEKWLDCPLVVHCGGNPFYGERFQKLIDGNPEKYGMCRTTDGGVAVAILGPAAEDAPEHGRAQDTDYAWFTMNDGGYQLAVVDMSDVHYYCWYRP